MAHVETANRFKISGRQSTGVTLTIGKVAAASDPVAAASEPAAAVDLVASMVSRHSQSVKVVGSADHAQVGR